MVVVLPAMNEHSLARALSLDLNAPDDALLAPAAGVSDSRAEFEARFIAELQRLERGRHLDSARADSLLSALGAAGVREWELALAFLDAAIHAPAKTRRAALSLGVLRRRFQLVMSVAGAR